MNACFLNKGGLLSSEKTYIPINTLFVKRKIAITWFYRTAINQLLYCFDAVALAKVRIQAPAQSFLSKLAKLVLYLLVENTEYIALIF
jgi:hypothetical protein